MGQVPRLPLVRPPLMGKASSMSSERKLAIAIGVLFHISDLTSVVAAVLYQPVLNHPGYVLGHGAANSRILLGGLLEVILAAAVIGTAVTLYPVVRFHSRAPGLVCGINTFVIAYALYRSKLVARFIPVLGLIGGPLVFAANVAFIFGVPRDDLGVLVVPIFAWEICLATFLILKGFRSPATTTNVSSEVQYPQLTAA